jgi:NAD(P)-dependent dehydrogenase (short-subunit alcohol dehydrogenase family)
MSLSPEPAVPGTPVVVVGASRGLGRGVATAFADAGHEVVAIGRDAATLPPGMTPVVGDATDEELAATVLSRYQPSVLVVVAGARPPMMPLSEQTWESLSVPWNADVRIAFTWIGEALRLPLSPGSRVIVFSSGAALRGSPLSGGYAGAKAMQRFLAAYAGAEAERAGLGLTFTSVLPKLTPATGLGREAVRTYAADAGADLAEYTAGLGAPLTPELAGAAIRDLAARAPGDTADAYVLASEGLTAL